jgi:hypothetical protein
MHKTLLAIAAIIGCSGYFIQSLSSAHAVPTGPTVSSITQPWRTFTGEATSGFTDLVYVPEGQVFIVTTFLSGEVIDLYEDTTVKFDGHSNGSNYGGSHNKVLAIGNGHVVFESGHTVRVRNSHTSGGYRFYVEGYFAHA